MKKLPIGIQTFKEIIQEKMVYVDKTMYAFELIKNYKYTTPFKKKCLEKLLLE